MPGIKLPEELIVEPFGSSELAKDDIVLIVVPSSQVRNVAIEMESRLDGQLVVNCSKGFEHSTMKTLSQVLEEYIGTSPLVIWSGPNIAREIAEGKPTRAVLACRDMAVLARASRMLKNPLISFEISRDVRGVEMVASLKGIIAISIGLADGLELGDNFVGLVLSYALREFVAIAEFMEIPAHTIYGIAGLGDCVTSSLSPHGRNRRFGKLLAQGIPPQEAIKQVGMVVEGVAMMQTITELEDLNVPVPICSIIKKIIFEPNGDVRDLLVNTVMTYRS
ncbi:NAD(P)H-dependent glycerol-3-phosphate dehydrogenase, partial [Calditrichota bacterium]